MVMVNGANYFNEKSFREACDLLDKGHTIEMYVDVIGHTRNNIVQEEYKEALYEKYGKILRIDKRDGAYNYGYNYALTGEDDEKV